LYDIFVHLIFDVEANSCILCPSSFPTRRSSDLLRQIHHRGEDLEVRRGRESGSGGNQLHGARRSADFGFVAVPFVGADAQRLKSDRKSTRLNSSQVSISYAVFCVKNKKKEQLNI